MKFYKKFPLFMTLFATIALLAVGCGGGDDEEMFPMDGEGDGGGATSGTVDMSTAATVTGSIVFEGTAPAPKKIDMSADQACVAGGDESGMSQDVLVKDGKLANVFVYVSDGLGGKKFPKPEAPAVLDQKGCTYYPHVLGVMVDQTITIKNDDETLHNVHAMPKVNKGFNLAQPIKGTTNEESFSKEEVMIPIACDVHGWMKCYVGVLTHPAFDVSKEDGTFTFKAPEGEYTITAWHEKLGTQEQKVTLGANESKDISFTFSAGS